MKPAEGILLVDKAPGPTSHDLVARLRKITGLRRVGHAGTLDPFASGLLLTLLGPATRLSEYFLGMDKEYLAELRLGIETISHDPDGEVVSETPGWDRLDPAGIEAALEGFRGTILQRPPRYSAKKVRGEAAYRRTRRGEAVELKPREVRIHELELLEVELPVVKLRVLCSSGTYVRALARDLGRALELGAHLIALRRTSIGSFSVESALPLDDQVSPEAVQEKLISPASALAHLPSMEVDQERARRLRQGRFLDLAASDLPQDVPVRVLLAGELVAVAARRGEELRPRKVFGSLADELPGRQELENGG